MSHPATGIAIAATALGLAARPSPAPPSFERLVAVEAAGRVAVRLDRDVYESARADLGDLRLVDPGGREVPYVLDRGGREGPAPVVRPAVRNRGWQADGAATAVLDFGGRVPKRRLDLRLSGGNFRRRVAVLGGDDGAAWTTLVEEAWVFAVPSPEPARYETVALPENDLPLLRVVVHPAPDEGSRPAIEDAWVAGDGRAGRLEETLTPRWSQARDATARETWLLLDLGARHQPFEAIEIDVADERFFREVRVEVRHEPDAVAGPVRWEGIARGQLHRLEHAGRLRECRRVEAVGRARALRVRVRDGDDQPLLVRAVAVKVPVETLLFEATGPGEHRLTYGADGRLSPTYDLVRTAGDLAEWGRTARAARLGPPRRLAATGASERPWTERHPTLLWAGLVAVVLALGGLTWSALRRAR